MKLPYDLMAEGEVGTITIEFPRKRLNERNGNIKRFEMYYPHVKLINSPNFDISYMNGDVFDRRFAENITQLTPYKFPKLDEVIHNLNDIRFVDYIIDLVMDYCEKQKINYLYTFSFKEIFNTSTGDRETLLLVRGSQEPQLSYDHPSIIYNRRKKQKAIEEIMQL